MIFYVSGRETDDLLMVLEGVKGVKVKRSAERKKRKYFEKGARKESMGEASGTVFLERGMGEGEMAAVRDIVVEGVRAKEVEIAIKGDGDAEAAFVGPSDDEDRLRVLAGILGAL